MKKISYTLALLFTASIIFSSCRNNGDNEPVVYATHIIVDPNPIVLSVGETKILNATVVPQNAYNRALYWTSSNGSIVTVDNHGRITAHSTGTAHIIVNLIRQTGNIQVPQSGYTVFVSEGRTEPTQGGTIINGIEWATHNVDVPGAFTENPEDAGMFFQWNRRVGWSSSDPLTSIHWDSSVSASAAWLPINDPCPIDWRVPSPYELVILALASNTWVSNWNNTDVSGRIFGTAPNQIFLPAAGGRNTNGVLGTVGTDGWYWHSSATNMGFGWYLHFNSTNVLAGSEWSNRAGGFSVRCVAE